MPNINRPIIQYPGGKWKIAPWVLQYEPPHKYYTESFGGGGSILLSKTRSPYEIYNDTNNEVVCLFKVLRDQPEEFIRRVELTPYSREEYNRSFEASENLDDLEIARRFIYRVTASFGTNGILKTNKHTWLYSKHNSHALSWSNMPYVLEQYIDRLKGIYIECKDAKEVILQWDDPETWHYIDPPYVTKSRSNIQMYPTEMTDEDHRELAEVLNSVKGKVTISGYNNPLYDELYKDWVKVEKTVQVWGVNLDGVQSKRVECLWMNYSLESETLPFFNPVLEQEEKCTL